MALDRCNVQTATGLWMRPAYMEGFRDKTITAVVRRRDRSDPKDPTYIPLNVDIPVRFIEKPGVRETNAQPKLYPDDGTTVRLTRHIVKQIGQLVLGDLVCGSLDIATAGLVRYHLSLIDNTPLLGWDEVVTVYHFEHRPKATE